MVTDVKCSDKCLAYNDDRAMMAVTPSLPVEKETPEEGGLFWRGTHSAREVHAGPGCDTELSGAQPRSWGGCSSAALTEAPSPDPSCAMK